MKPLSWLEGRLDLPTTPAWTFHEPTYNPSRESGVESRFAIGNGFLGVRASRAISRGPMWVSWLHTLNWASSPRTYIAGLFDIPNTEPPVPALVPAPDWLRLRVILDGEPMFIRSGKLLTHHRVLDVRRGLMLTEWQQETEGGHLVQVRSLRMVSQAERSLGVQVLELKIGQRPVDATLEATIEGTGTALEIERLDDDLALWRTTSGKWLSLANDAGVAINGKAMEAETVEPLKRSWSWRNDPSDHAMFWRTVAFARGDEGAREPAVHVQVAMERARTRGWQALLDDHEAAWAARWADADIELDGDEEAQKALRFAVYHLVSAANPEDERVSIGARALTGDSYLGHVFWDTEIYLLPFYTLTWPEAARALLMYRYHTLAGARAKAERMGYRGALYAWESADTGEETTPEAVLDLNGNPIQVLCGTQEQHISADVAYAVWQYWRATGDDQFLLDGGAEIILDTARFWASRAALEDDGKYHIRGVIGPDEYHEHIDDNAYTNILARWNIERGLEVVAMLAQRWPQVGDRLTNKLDLREAELETWRDVAGGLVTGFRPDKHLFEQFEGFFGLEQIDLDAFKGRTVPMDVILGRERTQGSQVVKQADVVALLALLPHAFSPETHIANFEYYEPRCGHGSSLSRGMHALVAARLGRLDRAMRHFKETAATDITDQALGSAGGIHIASMGALWQAAVFGFAGLTLRDDGLEFDPHIPGEWKALSFRLHWRGRRLHVRLDANAVQATLEAGEPMDLYVGADRHTLSGSKPQTIPFGGYSVS
ncbi:MAG: glycoside hydrolase family 65 protein [Rhodospirillales bacterium]|nr:glycoside hydrolase family 65 protein [Rhodospirillales bacterium]